MESAGMPPEERFAYIYAWKTLTIDFGLGTLIGIGVGSADIAFKSVAGEAAGDATAQSAKEAMVDTSSIGGKEGVSTFYTNQYGITTDADQYERYVRNANGFSGVKGLEDFESRISANAQNLPWRPIPRGVTDGVKYRWIDEEGNLWNARAHSIDPSAPLGRE